MSRSPDAGGSDGFGSALRRDRIVVVAMLASVTALAWWQVIRTSRSMSGVGTMMMPMSDAGGTYALAWLVPMWIVMMTAMMTPTAAPTMAVFATIVRQRRPHEAPAARVTAFALGYLLVWSLYGTIAAVVQATLHRFAALSPAMTSASAWLGGGLLLAAGMYQWLPFKHVCLSRCRSPLAFVLTEWRDGWRGALVMGVRHGIVCAACCALLMALLFVLGVMNLAWVAAIAVAVFVEKVLPAGRTFARATGVLLAAWGIVVLAMGR
jgi:predicted metal-binding membrane protein